ncbi:MAG TPA: hypothetical protein VFG94_03925 [Acidimicrobiales bacterium]|jgi:DNA-binding IscR family transcriptional regulator|nr:hypothetical protein [Acidimicrobiales bacterium]
MRATARHSYGLGALVDLAWQAISQATIAAAEAITLARVVAEVALDE